MSFVTLFLSLSLSLFFGLLPPGSRAAASFEVWSSAGNPCPRLCPPNSLPAEWNLYSEIDQLTGCNGTMLLDFSVYSSGISGIRACVVTEQDAGGLAALQSVPSPAELSSSTTQETKVKLQLGWWGSIRSDVSDNTHSAVELIQKRLPYMANHSIDSMFSYSGNTVVGLYIGRRLHGPEVATKAVQKLAEYIEDGPITRRTALQYCKRTSDVGFGIVVDTNMDIAAVQQIVRRWNNAECLTKFDGTRGPFHTSLQMKDSISAATRHPAHARRHPVRRHGHGHVHRRNTCSTIRVNFGDTCPSLADECGISGAEFSKYNPDDSLCTSLMPGQYVCCSAGELPDMSPQPNDDGTCASHLVQAGESCSEIATANALTVDELESFNQNTWGWMGCDHLQSQQTICLSKGDPPMPTEIKNAECGPQVPGTERPSDWSKLESLNPCPLNACCNIWGQCGVTPKFCTETKSPTGAPGTAAVDTNGCISNCGTDIVNNNQPPSEFINVAYFEAFNLERSCLTMDVRDIDTSKYSHVHFAFGSITDSFAVDLTAVRNQFEGFAQLRSIKRIIAFGGWSFSTSADTYAIFRKGVTDANRHTLAKNIVDTVIQYDLDGVDFDWEYPEAPDIPGIPPGDERGGERYLKFLKEVRGLLPDGKTLSIAAPASFWYLRGFPIDEMAKVVDYIIYMTYDLHGQWDYGNKWVMPECPVAGACLRSHVNLTETNLSLSMITKAGVPSNKIITGITSYGRGFEMTEPGCTGPLCTYTGPESGATPGRCTDTAGYLANAEIYEIIANDDSANAMFDAASQSNILVYDTTQWVAYMNESTKATRSLYYKLLNMGGTTDWAVDLQEFRYGEGSSRGTDLLYMSPEMWEGDTPEVTCNPPCTMVLPPFPLGTTTTVTWPPHTMGILTRFDNGQTSTKTSTVTLDPFTMEGLPLWPLLIGSSDPTSMTVEVTQSVKPPEATITLSPSEATIPPTHFRYAETESPSTKEPVFVVEPVFVTTERPVPIQPQPTISITTPSLTIPPVTYSSGTTPSPTTSKGCDGCGWYNCMDFGCNGGCGRYACEGGCGIRLCGIQGGGAGGGAVYPPCPVVLCGGIPCALGVCGAAGCPNGDCGPTSCKQTKTASNCVEFCTPTTNAADITSTTCTSATCLPTVGCYATGTTKTVTSTTEAACSDYPPASLTKEAFRGCRPCSFGPFVTEDPLMARGMPAPTQYAAMRKPQPKELTIEKAGGCQFATPVSLAWTGGVSFARAATNGRLEPSQTSMDRWYSVTTSACVPEITKVNDATVLSQSGNGKPQSPTNDHVWERNWLNEFFAELVGGPMTCQSFNDIFFPQTCENNLLQQVYGAMATNNNWDFIGMTDEVNQIKGDLGGNYEQKVATFAANARSDRIRPGMKWAGRNSISNLINKKINVLRKLTLGCVIWANPSVNDMMQRTNRKIYSKLLAVDQYNKDNNVHSPVVFADEFKSFMNKRVQRMAFVQQLQVGLTRADTEATIMRAAAEVVGAEAEKDYDRLKNAFDSLVKEYSLGAEDTGRCNLNLQLDWEGVRAKRASTNVCSSGSEDNGTDDGGGNGGGNGSNASGWTPEYESVIIGLWGNINISWGLFYPSKDGSFEAWCFGTAATVPASPFISLDNVPYPPDIRFDTNEDGSKDCRYISTPGAPGKYVCHGKTATCQDAPDIDEVKKCHSPNKPRLYVQKVQCFW